MVTVTLDNPASDWAAEPGPFPADEAISPDADRWVPVPFTLLASLPFTEEDEVGTPRAEVRLYVEPMLTRLLASASEKEKDERLLDRAGSGKWRCWAWGEFG